MANIKKKKYLGDYLIEAGIINENQLQEALDYQKETLKQGNVELLGQTLVEMGYCTSEDIMLALAMKDGVPFMVLDQDKVDEEAINLLSPDLMERYMAIPVGFENDKLLVAMLHPNDVIAIDDLRIITGFDIQPIIIPDFQLYGALEQAKSGILGKITFDFTDSEASKSLQSANGLLLHDVEIEDTSTEDGFELKDDIDTRPAVQLANTIFNQAVESRASDVHIEPYEKKTRVRFRIDGVLHEVMNPPKRLHPSLVSRIKVMANMDIAERRIPQDGRITLIIDSKTVDVRVASLPTAYGEKLTLRLLNRSEKLITLPELGFPGSQLEIFNRIIELPYGFVLVTGPTGSGKSTTLYAVLSRLNSVDKNIITIEDPIERRIDGINQTQVNVRAGMTFASGLRSFLRNDPDIMMVGEIRDYETARIAIESALTGHMVLSTLHTNTAAGAITRLIEMGIEPFLVASSLTGIVAQRLARVLCPHCKEPYEISREDLLKNVPDFPLDSHEEVIRLYRANSCYQCNNTGYRGRVGLYELLPVSQNIRRLILDGESDTAINNVAIKEGMISMRQHALTKVKDGITSIEEVLRVIV